MALPPAGFLGLGAMGGGMAKHLVKEGFSVTGYDVYPPSVESFVAAGGEGATSPRDVAASSEIITIMVTSAAQVASVLFSSETGAVHGLKPGAAIVMCSTVPPSFAPEVRKRLDEEFKRPDVLFLDCPVSGGTPRAASGELSIFSSGTPEGLKKASPVLKALSKVLYEIPGGVRMGSNAKMCHQVMAMVEIAFCNELMALVARAGLNTQETLDAVQKSDGQSWMNGNRIPHMLEGDMSVYSGLANATKDSSIIVNEARTVLYPVLMTSTAEQVFLAAANAGFTKDDDSTLWRLYLTSAPQDAIFQMTKPSCTLFSRQDSVTVQDIIDVCAGAHLAVSAEAMGFTEKVGLDTAVMFDIIDQGAGANAQFSEHVPKMKKPTWSVKDAPGAPSVCKRLESALTKAHAIGASLPVAAAALELLKMQLQ